MCAHTCVRITLCPCISSVCSEGRIDRTHFVSVLYPPDTHPHTKAYPTASHIRSVRARALMPAWSHTPSAKLMQSSSDVTAPPLAEDVPASAPNQQPTEEEGGGSVGWMDIPSVDAQGVYTHERDKAVERCVRLPHRTSRAYSTLQPRLVRAG